MAAWKRFPDAGTILLFLGFLPDRRRDKRRISHAAGWNFCRLAGNVISLLPAASQTRLPGLIGPLACPVRLLRGVGNVHRRAPDLALLPAPAASAADRRSAVGNCPLALVSRGGLCSGCSVLSGADTHPGPTTLAGAHDSIETRGDQAWKPPSVAR